MSVGPQVEEIRSSLTPWEVARRLARRPHLLFLDSARPDERLGRFSFVTADPFAWVTARGTTVTVSGNVPGTILAQTSDPFVLLRQLLTPYTTPTVPGLPPFQGGIAGLWGYDLCHHIERLPRPGIDEFAVPDLAMGLYDWVFAVDHVADRAWLIATGLPELDPARRPERARHRLRQVRDWLCGPAPTPAPLGGPIVAPVGSHTLAGFPGVTSNRSRSDFEAAIRRGIEYVHAGDCFQVNLAQRLLAPLKLPPMEVYARLRQRNPAPFAGFLDLGDFALASASPERFLQIDPRSAAGHGVQGREVRTRPIKGTRPRSASPTEDAAIRAELLTSAKDRAENVMIVDLLRNDLGRVCAYGTVRPTEVCTLESYEYVHHLVSEVRGELRPECDRIDLLRATFPGGSVTGAPKVRAMEIIAELEPCVRGPYCGSLGYLGFDGSMDTNLLIRTLTLGRGWMQFPVGGGIVADSQPGAEYDETLHKARGLLRVLDP
jgi:para-aminobenzoate synthetase component 1